MKIVVISSLLPTGHYTEILLQGFHKQTDVEIIVYTDQNPENKSVKGCGKVKPVWRKNTHFLWDILKTLDEDKPDLIHVHHELNMYGSMITAFLFPFLLMGMRMKSYRIITTIHGVVAKKQITPSFIELFLIDRPFYIIPLTLRFVFQYIYGLTAFFSDRIICHSHLLKQSLEEYGISSKKVMVIETAIPAKQILNIPKKNYFFYFGYMVRRKGLQHVLEGFKEFIKKHPGYQLILAGGTIAGQEKAQDEILEFIKKNNLEKNVELKGFIKTETELAKLYGEAYAVVIPAVISVAASGPLYQAQGYHKAVLASNVGNFTEEIDHMKTGILVENNQWAEAFSNIIHHSELVKKLEQGSRKRAEEKSQENTVKKYVNVYTSLIK